MRQEYSDVEVGEPIPDRERKKQGKRTKQRVIFKKLIERERERVMLEMLSPTLIERE